GSALSTALATLEAVDPEHLGTIETLDMALVHLLRSEKAAPALYFLSAKLRDGRLTIKNFDMTARELARENPQRLYELMVNWLLSGSIQLCNNVSEFVGSANVRAFDATVQPLDLTPAQQVFLCRKAVGFLFLRPIVCCSMIVSVLRA